MYSQQQQQRKKSGAAEGAQDVLLMAQRVWEKSVLQLPFGESQPTLFELVDVVAQFERGSQLQSQILHHHLAFQQEQGVPVYLLQSMTDACVTQNVKSRRLPVGSDN